MGMRHGGHFVVGLWVLVVGESVAFCSHEVEDEEEVRELEEQVRFAFLGAKPKIRLQLRCLSLAPLDPHPESLFPLVH